MPIFFRNLTYIIEWLVVAGERAVECDVTVVSVHVEVSRCPVIAGQLIAELVERRLQPDTHNVQTQGQHFR